MNSIALVHPRLLAMTPPALYPSLCTIQDTAESPDASGYPVQTPVNRTGLIDIPCRKMNVGDIGRYNAEQRLAGMTLQVSENLVELKGYYPTIVPKNTAVVDGVAHDILGVGNDGNHVITVLRLKIIA